MEWMVHVGDDAFGNVEEAFATEEIWKEKAGIDAAAMEIALAVGEEPVHVRKFSPM